MTRPIYLDHHATTPIDSRVLERMLPFFAEEFGNAASASHPYGWRAAQALEGARAQVASLVGARPPEVILTSGATEAINLALLGVARAATSDRPHIITQVTEHAAVLETVDALERDGVLVTRLPVDGVGRVSLDDLAGALERPTLAVSIMLANNEIGTIQPVDEIGRLCRAAGALFHCDLTQAAGWYPIDVHALDIDLAAISSHKIYGPKGAGALVVRRRRRSTPLGPVVFGGGQEGGLRPGTANVPAIVGFGEACAIALDEGAGAAAATAPLRDRLQSRLVEALPGVRLNGCPERRHPGNLNLSVEGVHSEVLLSALPDIAFSGGSACASGSAAPSHVLAALGPRPHNSSVVRFGLGRSTTRAQVDHVARRLVEVVRRLRTTAAPAAPGRG